MQRVASTAILDRMSRLVLFAFLCALISACSTPKRADSAASPAPLLLISIDGFRPDYLFRGNTPTLDRLAREGAYSAGMQASYPSLTFPNHYTLVTGLHPDRHGIVNNTMRDTQLGQFSMQQRDAVRDGRWWQGEPIWLTVQRAGLRAATLFWPGAEADIQGEHPAEWRPYDASLDYAQRLQVIEAWLRRPLAQRPHFMTLYFESVDTQGHYNGPRQDATEAAIRDVDSHLAQVVAMVDQYANGAVNLLIVSDHGMTAVDPTRNILLDELLPADSYDLISYGASAGIEPRPGREQDVEAVLLSPHASMSCHRREALPTRWHFGKHPRVPSIICQAVPPWIIANQRAVRTPAYALQPRVYLGAHGFDPALPEMQALFVAQGPGIRAGVTARRLASVDIYALMCALLDVQPAPNQGDPDHIRPLLRRAH